MGELKITYKDLDREIPFFMGTVRFLSGGVDDSRYYVLDGGAVIEVLNSWHVRLIETPRMPRSFNMLAPMGYVNVIHGDIPDTCKKMLSHNEFREVCDAYANVQLLNAAKEGKAEEPKQEGCLSMVVTGVLATGVFWLLLRALGVW